MARRASKGSVRPRSAAVPGMNCAMPCAPFGLTASERKRLSFQISRVKKPTGRSWSAAEVSMRSQRVSWVASASSAAVSAAASCVAASTSAVASRSGAGEGATSADPAAEARSVASAHAPPRSTSRRGLRRGMPIYEARFAALPWPGFASVRGIDGAMRLWPSPLPSPPPQGGRGQGVAASAATSSPTCRWRCLI